MAHRPLQWVENAHQVAKSKEVYATIKKITKSATTKMQSVKSKTDTILTEQSDVKERWKENYQELYNEHNPINEAAANILPINSSSDPESYILKDETESAIKKLSEEKAPGLTQSAQKKSKQQGEREWIFPTFLQSNMGNWTIPWGLRKSYNNPNIIIKRKPNLTVGTIVALSLLFHAGKVMVIILQRRILKRTEEILSESQAGFRPGRATVDQIFTLRQITENYLEKDKNLYCCYIDFQKAFDSVWRRGLWKAMEFLRYPSKLISLLQALCSQSHGAVKVNGELTEWFKTAVGVRQGCVISPPPPTVQHPPGTSDAHGLGWWPNRSLHTRRTNQQLKIWRRYRLN